MRDPNEVLIVDDPRSTAVEYVTRALSDEALVVRVEPEIVRLVNPYATRPAPVRASLEWDCRCGSRPNPPERTRCRGCGRDRPSTDNEGR